MPLPLRRLASNVGHAIPVIASLVLGLGIVIPWATGSGPFAPPMGRLTRGETYVVSGPSDAVVARAVDGWSVGQPCAINDRSDATAKVLGADAVNGVLVELSHEPLGEPWCPATAVFVRSLFSDRWVTDAELADDDRDEARRAAERARSVAASVAAIDR